MKLSIIIPVFNIEEYLPSCIDSILNQNFKDYELLLINDGSTDKSGEIIDRYAVEENRIQVFHQQNKGVSAARNLGLEKAKGEWICFVDGDDTIYSNSLDALMKKTDNSELEMVIARSYIYERGIMKSERYKFSDTFLEKTFNGYGLIKDHFYKRGSVCGCIFNNNFLKENNIKFPLDLQNGEDSIFISLVHLYSQQIIFIDKVFYLVNEREGSASRNWTPERVIKMIDNLTFLNNYLENHPKLSKAQRAILNYNIYSTVSAIFNNLYYCFTLRNYFKILSSIKKELPNKIDTLDIKISKTKVRFLNFSLILFSMFVILKQLFNNKLKKI